jgi:hypothetical protein
MSENNSTLNTTEQTPPQLGLADLAAVVRIIDTVSRRGAFEGPELADVGGLRNRFVTFLNANAPKQDEQPATDKKAE